MGIYARFGEKRVDCLQLIISLTLFKGVEAIRDELAQVPPFQDWIPQGDILPEEKTCSTD